MTQQCIQHHLHQGAKIRRANALGFGPQTQKRFYVSWYAGGKETFAELKIKKSEPQDECDDPCLYMQMKRGGKHRIYKQVDEQDQQHFIKIVGLKRQTLLAYDKLMDGLGLK